MNAKLTILILVAMIAAVLVPVSAENVYVDRNPAKFDVLPPDAYGYVVFYIRAGGSAQDLNIWIGNDAKNATFDPYYHPDKSIIDGQNPAFLKVKVLMDGVSEPVQLASGNYTAYLQKGNGDQLEQFKFKIGGGATERVQFLGAAVSCPGERACKPVYKIIEAKYGALDACILVIDVPAHTEYSYWISSTPEHQEYRYRDWVQASYETVCYPEVNHTEMQGNTSHTEMVGNTTHEEWIPDVTHVEYRYKIWDWDCWCHKWSAWQIANPHKPDQQTRIVVDIPGHSITVDNMDGYLITVDDMNGQLVIVVDDPAYCEQVLVEAAHWGDWSVWSTTPVVAIPEQREVETKTVPADPFDGHYSEWSDTPEGLCTLSAVDSVAMQQTPTPNEPCITRWVDATYKCDGDAETIIDVTGEVQSVVNGGNLKFVFNNGPQPGGIFLPDMTEFLAEITDPAPGTVKTATITYSDGCGLEKTITAEEGALIDLTDGSTSA